MCWKAILFAAILLLPLPALAAVLWFGGEDTSVIAVGTVVPGTTAGTYDVNFARGQLAATNGSAATDPPTNYFKTQVFTSTAIIWVHANAFVTAVGTNTANQQVLFAYSPDGVGRVYLRNTGTTGQMKLSTANAARTFSDKQTATGNLVIGTLQTIDWLIDYSCSAGSVSQVYVNGTKIIDYTGSLCTDAATSLNQVGFSGLANGVGGSPCNGGSVGCWSEMIVANEDTRSMRLATLTLQASGNTQGWTPNTLANVNKFTIADGTFVSDTVGNVLSQWTVPTAAPGGIWIVKSVSVESRLLKGTSGPTQFDWSWRIAGANYLSGLTNALTTSFANYRIQQDTSPATATAWTVGEVFNTSTNQMNIGVKSLP
jgi:hypothetical protein